MRDRLIFLTAVLLIVAVGSSPSSAQATKALTVEAVTCSGVKDRMPVDTLSEFVSVPVDVYLWLRVSGARDTTAVTVKWFCQGKEVVATTLPVKSPSWRTWAIKTVRPGETGDWEARVLGPDAEILKSVSFKVLSEKPGTAKTP